ncbi:hypothetical protein G6N74_04760 [Mesorhizobium sp. CGMCC 1.15528]|uniref:Uncharacterized protein n=1 Tax=Mesorhizobium zhangyense TaxID=1776730 RepID=A0A7C9V790_9HYPH|nr:hypothetical protein [Mesorhizobium zhangyense]NGN40366.1 hypothetical protein [Mesorhizobium zhangyense]
MPLQNRIDPFGDIHAVPARGLFTGNRGVIHDPATRTLLKRRWATRAWIICVCEFRGKRRDVMGRNAPSGNAGWTELFFLDEVTALAAGHRPCFYCQRERAKEFAGLYGETFGVVKVKAPEMDARLHGERLAAGGKLLALNGGELERLPDGAMVARGGDAYAVHKGVLRRWSFEGYEAPREGIGFASPGFSLLTPAVTVAVLRAGYKPVWHESVGK